MQFDKILLIKPVYYGSHYGNRYLNAGLAYISEALSKSNIQNKIIDMGIGYNLDDLKNEISEYKTQLIGVSTMSFGYRHNYKMLEAIKQKHPDIPIVIGGPHMSTLRESIKRVSRY